MILQPISVCVRMDCNSFLTTSLLQVECQNLLSTGLLQVVSTSWNYNHGIIILGQYRKLPFHRIKRKFLINT